MTVDIRHVPDPGQTSGTLTLQEILRGVQGNTQQLDQHRRLLMALSQAIADFSAKVDVATNALAAKIQALIDKIAAGNPLTPEDQAALDGIVATLENMGKDPANPVPVTP
jgi:hypothetical protein